MRSSYPNFIIAILLLLATCAFGQQFRVQYQPTSVNSLSVLDAVRNSLNESYVLTNSTIGVVNPAPFDPNSTGTAPNYKAQVVKLDGSGNVLWTVSIIQDTILIGSGATRVIPTQAAKLVNSSDDGCYLISNSNCYINGNGDFYYTKLVKINASGYIEWTYGYWAESWPAIYQIQNAVELTDRSVVIQTYNRSACMCSMIKVTPAGVTTSQVTYISDVSSNQCLFALSLEDNSLMIKYSNATGITLSRRYNSSFTQISVDTLSTLTSTFQVFNDNSYYMYTQSQPRFYTSLTSSFYTMISSVVWLERRATVRTVDHRFVRAEGQSTSLYDSLGNCISRVSFGGDSIAVTKADLFNDGTVLLAGLYRGTQVFVARTDTSFSALTKILCINRPNGNERFQIGMLDTIRWASNNVSGNVNVEVKRNYPNGVWEMIAANISNGGVLPWMVTGPATSSAVIRVTSVSNTAIRDQSDVAFSIVQPSITLLSPNGTDSLQIGSYSTLQWNSSNTTGSVRIDLNRSYPSDNWETLFASVTNTGEQLWQITGPGSTTARLRVMSLTNATVGDTSASNFSIYGNYSGLYIYSSTSSLTFNTLIAPTMRDSLNVTVRVTGNQAMIGARVVTLSGPFRASPTNLPAVPAGYTTQFTVYFEPATEGTFNGTVVLVSNALNADTIRISCTGVAQWLPAVPRNLSLSLSGWNAQLNWSRVDSSMNGLPLAVTGYIAYYSEVSTGPWFYLAYTNGANSTAYTHSGAAHFSPAMYYRVRAWLGSSSDRSIRILRPGMSEAEVEQILTKNRFEE